METQVHRNALNLSEKRKTMEQSKCSTSRHLFDEYLLPIYYIEAVIIVFGCCGTTVFVIFYYWIDKNHLFRSRFNQHLAALCLSDIVLLVSWAIALWTDGPFLPSNGDLLELRIAINQSTARVGLHNAVWRLIGRTVVQVARTSSVWQLVLLAEDRYLAVTNPFEHRFRKINSAAISLIAACLSLVIHTVRNFFEYRVSPCTVNGVIYEMMVRANFAHHPTYHLFVRVGVDMLVTWFLPTVLITLLSYRTLVVRRRHSGDAVASVNFSADRSARKHKTSSGSISDSDLTTNISQRRHKPLGNSKSLSRYRTTYRLLLFLLMKLTLANGAVGMLTVLELLIGNGQVVHYSFRSTFALIVDVLLVFHCATNWIVFMNWNRRVPTTSSRQSDAVPRYQILTKAELERLLFLWNGCLKEEQKKAIGVEMINVAIEHNSALCRRLGEPDGITQWDTGRKRESFLNNAQVLRAGHRIADFIDYALEVLRNNSTTDEEAIVELRQELRHVGQVHCTTGVALQNGDWQAMKLELMHKLHVLYRQPRQHEPLSQQTLSDGSPLYQLLLSQIQEPSPGDSNVVNKFASFLIRELKCGFMCQEVSGRRNVTNIWKTNTNSGKERYTFGDYCMYKRKMKNINPCGEVSCGSMSNTETVSTPYF